ncbi:hypothetical protein MANES_14G151600v8 [Manihot esculenta]|uniref:Uncharacterized protein n=1 Tax=Manihot esculenta TaxID=3983 RepID=A0ACB7GI56_MANES|nr:hypothetical protein MANES_14G151600v8 [Manihot esculenta]
MSNASKNCLHKKCPSMEDDLKKAAEQGIFDPFNEHLDHLDCIVTENGNTILHVHLRKLLGKKSEEFMRRVVGNCPKLLTQENCDGNAPLHIAARQGRTDVAEELIRLADDLYGGNVEAVREMLRKKNNKEETALHVAARNDKSVGVVKAILRKEDTQFDCYVNDKSVGVVKAILRKEDTQFDCYVNDSLETPLELAIENSCTHIVAELLNHFDSQSLYTYTQVLDMFDGSVMHKAVKRWNTEIVRLLLEKESGLAKIENDMGWTPLHIAAFEGCSSMVSTLLNKDKSIACITTGWTALHIAALRGFKHVVNEIITKCPECCEITDDRGWNVLHFAVMSENDELLKMILENSSLAYLIIGEDNAGHTPVHLFKSLNIPLPSFILDGDTDGFILWKDSYNEIREDFTMKDMAVMKNITRADKEIDGEDAEIEYYHSVSHLTSSDNSADTFKIVKHDSENIKKMRKKREERIILHLEKAKDSHLVVATLIATVTFAAAFTVPGGYISDKEDSEKGTPILIKNLAFKAFIISDAMAMVLSTSSVFIYFIMVMLGSKPKYHWLIKTAFRFIFLAMGAMVVAFLVVKLRKMVVEELYIKKVVGEQ